MIGLSLVWRNLVRCPRRAALMAAGAAIATATYLVLVIMGIGTTMTMSILERLPELGALRAVGWTRWRVAALVSGEMVILAAAGFIVAIPLAHLAMGVLDQRLALWFGDPGPGLLPVLEGGILVLVASVLGGLPGLWAAVRVRPAHALRRVNLLK